MDNHNRKNNRLDSLDEQLRVEKEQTEYGSLVWLDPTTPPFHINGFAWFLEEAKFCRLPENPTVSVPDAVRRLSQCTAGGQIRFQTNSTTLVIKVKLRGKAYMSHMPAIGQCGFDCYIGEPGNSQFFSSTNYDLEKDFYEVTLFERKTTDFVSVTLNFPLYQGVESVRVGVDKEATVMEPPPFRNNQKVIVYGTSITQGGCASRPGLNYTNILSRRLNQEFVNLGFSGNGKGEENMAKLIREIDSPACLILDYEPNCVSTALYKKTLPTFISTFRKKHAHVPILIVSKFRYATELLYTKLQEDRMNRLAFQRNLVKQLRNSGDTNIYFCDGTNILGERWDECTVDGVHPNDLGFMQIANQLEKELRNILD